MSRSRAFLSILSAAAVAAAITATAMFLIGERAAPHPTTAPAIDSDRVADVLNGSSETVSASAGPSTPRATPTSFAELTRTSVDWAAIYERAVQSLVAVRTPDGAGSGFFVDSDGHIVTNFHVIANATDIVVFLQNGARLEAEFIAKDAGNDLALLKIDPDGVEIAVPIFGPIDELRVGAPVGALGAPFNLPNSLTVGIISALDRQRQSNTGTWEPLRGMIQTDAALNPGNSGGMLLDERGRVIGIPTQIESLDRAFSGIGFAVSTDAMLRSLPTLLNGEDVERSYLGVSLQETEDRLEVVDVTCGSAADNANVRDGDRILRINDQSSQTFDELVTVLANISPGDRITLTVQRGLRRLTLEATVTAWPSEPPLFGCG